MGYIAVSAGKTGGSHVTFTNSDGDYIRLHKPHPRNVLKMYQVNDVIAVLTERGLLRVSFRAEAIRVMDTEITCITRVILGVSNCLRKIAYFMGRLSA